MYARQVLRYQDKKQGNIKPANKGQYGRRILYNIIEYNEKHQPIRNIYLHATKGWKSRSI